MCLKNFKRKLLESSLISKWLQRVSYSYSIHETVRRGRDGPGDKAPEQADV